MAGGILYCWRRKGSLVCPETSVSYQEITQSKSPKSLYTTEAFNHKGSLLQETYTILIYRNGKEHVGVDVSIDLERLKSSVSGGETPD